jgi:hypothetical protein
MNHTRHKFGTLKSIRFGLHHIRINCSSGHFSRFEIRRRIKLGTRLRYLDMVISLLLLRFLVHSHFVSGLQTVAFYYMTLARAHCPECLRITSMVLGNLLI